MTTANRHAVHFSSAKADYETPPEVFEPLDREFHFVLDACALPDNTKCAWWYGPEQDGLKMPWFGTTVWVNPPYGKGMGDWVKKSSEEAAKGATVVMLIPARTDTSYWHEYIWDREHNRPRPGVEVRFVKGRIKFVGAADGAPFPSAIVVFRSAA